MPSLRYEKNYQLILTIFLTIWVLIKKSYFFIHYFLGGRGKEHQGFSPPDFLGTFLKKSDFNIDLLEFVSLTCLMTVLNKNLNKYFNFLLKMYSNLFIQCQMF